MSVNKAVFLDRDGVLIEDTGYVANCNHVRILPMVSDAIKLLKDFLIVVVTNQAGIAKGILTEYQVREINQHIKNILRRQGANIDRIYYCPHHPQGTVKYYAQVCDCRKPGIGMIKKAESDLDIDLNKSFVVGDKQSDVDTGIAAGCKTILLSSKKNNDTNANYVATDLYEAAEWIIKEF